MISKLNILIIDDDEDDFYITSQYLQEINGFEVTCEWCYNTTSALNELSSNKHDVYFIDYRLGAKTGLEILKQAIDNGCNKPVVLLTGKGNEQIDRLAVECGAYDYLVKSDLSSEKLERCLRYSVERYRTFKLIADNEKKYRLLFENVINFIFTCDNILHFTECNSACYSLLGYYPNEIKGKSIFDFIAEKDKNILKKLITDKQHIKNHIVEFETKNKESILGNLSLTYFELPDQQSYWQGVVIDETIRQQAEQTNLQKEKLDATYRLVRTLAHEIRNPLTNIGLSVEVLEEDNIEEQKKLLDIIKRSSGRINNIITEILQSSKSVNLNLELFDLNQLIRDTIEVASDRIKLKNIQLTSQFPDHSVVKLIDVEKFKIAILNIIVNAIEAMDKETKNLKIKLVPKIETVDIIIKDNGSGIKEENLKSLFEPYFTTKKTGMGLGLISTLNILKSHNAEIKVDSLENEGTTFTISMPH